jgi:hypothetical protein
MPFSSGTFSLYSPGNPVVEGTDIEADWANNTLNDIATGLSNAILKDGSQTVTANIPFSNFRLTSVGLATALTDAPRMSQVQNLAGSNLTNVAGTNTITATATPTPAYTVGQRFTFIPAVTNTGAVTLNITSVGAGAVQWAGAALTGGELVAGTAVTVLVTAATPVFEIVGATQFPDTRALVVGGTDATKKVRFEADGITTGTTRVVTVPDHNITIGDAGVLATEQASTSGTSIAFSDIPSWATSITVMFVGVSTSGSSFVIVQIGDAGGIETSGYLSSLSTVDSGAATTALTTGFGATGGGSTAVYHGALVLTLEDAAGFTWVEHGVLNRSDTSQSILVSGSKSLSAALTQLSITTVNGTDTFDAGAINILYR